MAETEDGDRSPGKRRRSGVVAQTTKWRVFLNKRRKSSPSRGGEFTGGDKMGRKWGEMDKNRHKGPRNWDKSPKNWDGIGTN
jgi:hypothetical protein